METGELRYLAIYARRIADAEGDLTKLREVEFKHLQQLIRKYTLELAIAETEGALQQQVLL